MTHWNTWCGMCNGNLFGVSADKDGKPTGRGGDRCRQPEQCQREAESISRMVSDPSIQPSR